MSLMVVVEGDTDIPVVRALAKDAGLEIASVLDMQGKSQIDRQLIGFNNAAKGSPWLVLRDLDEDASCAPDFLASTKLRASNWMLFRLAVREVEAWLLADTSAIAEFFHVAEGEVPLDPDLEKDPTVSLVNLARRSTRSAIRKAMVPAEGADAQVGRLYEATLIEFATEHWSLARACKRSDSLKRARAALRKMGARWRHVTREDS
jgi:hypothetical protein